MLLKAVAENPQLGNLVTANQTALNALARAQKELFKLPGVQVVKTPVVNVKGN